MRVLVVCRAKGAGVTAFIQEQVESLRAQGVEIELFRIPTGGIRGYLRAAREIRHLTGRGEFDVVHAHYGLSALAAVIQRKVPVVTTFHGSDVGYLKTRLLSWVAHLGSAHSVFVERGMAHRLWARHHSVVACGVDLSLFQPADRLASRQKLGFGSADKIVLFAGHYDNMRKNAVLAKAAVAKLPGVRLVELKGYDRTSVAALMNAADCLLMTSFVEGSPQVVKEAMACGLPVVSVKVGDVAEVIGTTPGCHLTPYDADAIAAALTRVFESRQRTRGRQQVEQFDLHRVAARLVQIQRGVVARRAQRRRLDSKPRVGS